MTRADLPTLTVGGLVREYLADPVTKALRSYANKRELLGWWLASYGSKRVLDFGVLALRDARTKLQPGRAPATVNRHLSALRSACRKTSRRPPSLRDRSPRKGIWRTIVILR